MKKISKYSMGLGDRFGQEGEAQLRAILKAREAGITITPVWNKSHREHQTLDTNPQEVRTEADQAVKALGWNGNYFVDADHINRQNVAEFIEVSDFFTIDVAEYIGQAAAPEEIEQFVKENNEHPSGLSIPGIEKPFPVDEELLRKIARQFLLASREAGNIYRHILQQRGEDNFVTEVSMDEVENPQSPVELYFILKMLNKASVPIQTIAPKFTGNFYKGIDYEGQLEQFTKEFEQDILVIRHAVEKFGLPENLKLSIHSGSDKFSLYQPIKTILHKHKAGIHIKTAGTTWLEELIGLAEAGGDGLELAKNIYAEAYSRYEELTEPYKPVLDIQEENLPDPDEVNDWSGKKFAKSLRHQQDAADFNPDFRQLLHCAYKIAGEKKATYTAALKRHKEVVEKNVTENLWERHIQPLFINS
ncbi:tagaturonate epimerase family protein [Nafulsella turpanensis]|uniref:tagaturonate epimerase family protein n=1 Tax=Nafulsella turpanensis TaxID=1265690 RepID=UPI000476B81C|nr:tagaturonate epimerase family protein [Nafulsella turpanensis]